MSIDILCIEKGIAESHKLKDNVMNEVYEIKGCYNCEGHNKNCNAYFPITVSTITEEHIRNYLKRPRR